MSPNDDSARLPQPGDVVADRYRIDREIGHGGMAIVYAATQLGSGNRQVALKWLFQGRSNRDERRRRFLREARAAGSIQHPNVVRVYDAGEHDSGVYLVMELVVGESLSAYFQRGKLAPSQAVDLLMPALRGVAAAHKQGIIHRDLKPDNLFVCNADSEKREIKVLDFGLSKLIGPAADSLHTLPGTVVGTPQYMAPEQADSRSGTVDERSDVYTLGVIFYEAVAGRRPFESETLAGLLMKITREDPTPLHDIAPELPEAFADMIMWALARDPGQRPSSIEQLALGLEPFGSVSFAGNGRSSEARGSVRAPRRASDRAPASAAASVAPPPAQPTDAPSDNRKARSAWLAGAAAVVIAIIAFAYSRGRAPADATDLAPPAPHAPHASAAADPLGAPAMPAVAQPVEPAPSLHVTELAPPSAADAGAVAGNAAPAPKAPSDAAPSKRARATARPALDPRQAPAPPPASAVSTEAAPTAPPATEPAPRPKRSPGVADPWDE